MSDVRAFLRDLPGQLVAVGRSVARLARRRARLVFDRVADAAVQARRVPVVTYAALLDSHTLALGVRHSQDSLAVAARARGKESDGWTSPQPLGHLRPSGAARGLLSGTVDLGGLDGPGAPRVIEVVGIGAEGSVVTLLWAGEAPCSPVRGPSAEHATWELVLQHRRPVGLTVQAKPAAAVVTEILGRDHHVVVSMTQPGRDAVMRLRLRDQLVTELALTGTGRQRRCVIRDGDVPVAEGETVVLSVSTELGEVPLQRRHTDLRDPGRAVPLPTVAGADPTTTRPALRLVYRPSGQLAIRRLVEVPEASR